MTAKSIINKHFLNEDKSVLERFEIALKSNFFSLVFLLLRDHRPSLYIQTLVIVVQYIQLHYFTFHQLVNPAWASSKITDSLNSFFSYFLLSPYFKSASANDYVIFFFFLFCLLFTIVIASLYLSYYYQKTSIPLSTPISILKQIIYLWITVLYLPLTEFFASTWNCNSSGYHDYFNQEMECWVGIHMVLVIFAILVMLAFLPTSGFLVITFFECRQNVGDSTSMTSSRPNLYLLIYQTLLALAFSIMSGTQFMYILLAIILGGSLVIFIAFGVAHPYHQHGFQLMSASLAAITLWSAIMLCLAKLMEGQVFQGSVIAWMIGLPFIVVIILTNRDKQIESLIINVNKFANAEELIQQTRYLLHLVIAQHTDRHSAILLDGYIEVHKQTCNKEDCPLKQKKQKNNRITRAIMQANTEGFSEKHALLLQMIYKMYLAGIKKFPNNSDLRLSFAFFLLDHMKYKQQALQEINVAEQYRPSFDLQFIIFRYKRIIEMELQELRKEDYQVGIDMIPSSAAPPLISALAQSIEKSALLHMEFWSQLGEDTPDIGKLEVLGTRTINSIRDVQEKWNKLMKVAPNHQKSGRLYGRYLIEILNDDETGDEVLQKVRNAANGGAKHILDDEETDNFSTDPVATFVVSCDTERFGQIVALNQAGASMFWYNKSELINQKIQILMPKMYAKHHDTFLENFLNNGDVKNHVKERIVFTKNKAGYISPVSLQIRQMTSALQGISFVGTMQMERQFKPIGYVLVDENGHFEGISQACISILKFDLRYTQNKKTLADILPGILEDKSTYITKHPQPYTYFLPKELVDLQERQQQMDVYHQEVEQQLNLLCCMQELSFSTINAVSGYAIRFDRQGDHHAQSAVNSSIISKRSNNQLQPPKIMIKNQFYFFYQMASCTYTGEFAENHQYSDMISQRHDETIAELQENPQLLATSAVNAQPNSHNLFRDQLNQIREESKNNYAEGIKTVRLFKGRIGDIEDVNEDEMDQEDAEWEQQQQNQQMNQYYDDQEDNQNDSIVFKNRRNLNQLFSKQATPPAVRNMRIVSSMLMLILTTLAFVDYFLNVQQMSDVIKCVDIINQNNYIKADFQTILSIVMDLQLLQMGLYGTSKQEKHDAYTKEIQALLAEIEENMNLLQLNPLGLSNQDSSDAIIMQFSPTQNASFDFIEATQQMISKTFNIINTNISQMTLENPDLYFVQTNGFNNFLNAQSTQSNLFFDGFLSRTADNSSKLLIIVIIVAVTLLASVIVLIPVLLSIRFTKEEVVRLFLEVPDKFIKSLYQKCESFVSSLQIGEDDDAASEVEDMNDRQVQENEPMLGTTASPIEGRKKRRKYKSSAETQYGFFIKLAVGAIVVQGYFVYNYLIGKDLMSQFSQLSPEVNATTQAESIDATYANAERLMFMNANATFLNYPVVYIRGGIVNFMYLQDSLIHQEHSKNVRISNTIYHNAFNDIMMQNPCPLLNVSVSECNTFADGAMAQGLAVALTRYYENIRYLLTLYMKIQQKPNITFENLVPLDAKVFVEVTGIRKRDNELNLMNLPESVESMKLQHKYFREGFRYLMRKFRDSMQDSQSSYVTIRTALFIVFVMLMLAVYVLFWLPLTSKLGTDIWLTRSQLTMIPVSQIIRIKNIKGYIRIIINDNVQHE